MPVKCKKQKPEAMLLRVIRVAEILATVEDNPTAVSENSHDVRHVATHRELIVG